MEKLFWTMWLTQHNHKSPYKAKREAGVLEEDVTMEAAVRMM